MSRGDAHRYAWLNKLRRSWRYRLAYRLARPQAPKRPIPFRGPALIVGSALVSNLPDGFDSRFSVICVMPRLHSDTDVKILMELLERGFRLYTSDPHVAESTGLPHWSKKELRSSVCR